MNLDSWLLLFCIFRVILQSCVIAIVVPDVEALKEWAIDNDIDGTLSVLCNDERVKAMILAEMTRLGKAAGLKSFEQVRNIFKWIYVVLVINSSRNVILWYSKILFFLIWFQWNQAKDIYLHPDPFSVQNGLLTPTLKTKRPQIKLYFKPQLEDMYSKLN